MQICFATNNENKIAEVKKLLPSAIGILSLTDLGHTSELQEDQATLEGNSYQKASFVYENYGIPCFADDTGLEVFALDGAPGVYSARYAGAEKDPSANIQLLLDNLSNVDDRAAQFRTVITLKDKHLTKQFEGIVKGEILDTVSGNGGFGYDPVFKPEGYEMSFAEMAMEEKNKVSHRGKAIEKLIKYLTDHYIK